MQDDGSRVSGSLNPVNVSINQLRASNHFKLYMGIYMFVQALANVPSLSERTLRRDIAKAEVSTGSEIQVG